MDNLIPDTSFSFYYLEMCLTREPSLRENLHNARTDTRRDVKAKV